MRKYWKRILLRFDRSFSSNKVWKPALWVLGFCVVWTLALWLVGLAWEESSSRLIFWMPGEKRIDEVIRLVVGQSNYPIESEMPHWYQLLVAMVGTVFFTAFLISMFSNMLMNRAASHRKGFLHYYFENHILILGGSPMVLGLLKTIANDPELGKKEVVILTNQDAEELWVHIVPLLTLEEKKRLKLIIYHGERNMDKALLFSQAELASHIYILGENNEDEHDSINMDCWKRIGEIRKQKGRGMAKCYLSLERNASTYLFHSLKGENSDAKMETTIFNRLESVAQQILIGDDEQWKDCTLDRGGIEKDSDRYVHLVVVGMTQMGYAMATTAAHLCHFPNFDENAVNPIRTKITFIDPNAEKEMKFFKGRYPSLFDLSHWVYRDGVSRPESHTPKSEYGDFLDVQWEFLKGSVVDDWVRKELEAWRKCDQQLLTLAFCGDEEPERNMAQALYLPRGFFSLDEESRENKPMILVYQPLSDALMCAAGEVERYANIHPFGVITDCFDKNLNRRVAAGKRINYLYDKAYNNEPYVMMPCDEGELDDMWRSLSFANKMSNIYAANSIYCKFRSYKNVSSSDMNEETIDQLSRMEHARWNMEKLLVGFSAMPTEEREELNEKLRKDDEQARKKNNHLKKKEFIHKDIAPYDGLPEDSKKYDRAIVKDLKDVIVEN